MITPQISEYLFGASAALILLASLGVVLMKNPVRATILLILSFLPTALIYVMMQASFVGVLQILVYAGAIMMLFTFVIMMINPSPHGDELGNEEAKPFKVGKRAFLLTTVLGVFLLPVVYMAGQKYSVSTVQNDQFGTLGSIAKLIYSHPLDNPLTVSFELISFLILVGIVAALNFSRRRSYRDHDESATESDT